MGPIAPAQVHTLFGVPLHDVPSERRLREALAGSLASAGASRIYTPNPEIMLHARQDPAYADLLGAGDLTLPDGAGLALLLSL
ncbi:MAG: hypothetical protein ACRELC_11865, partial [Gemmatimonadota bacterium]